MQHAVLLVDDDQHILHGLARTLRRQPYRLLTATSGDEAVLVLKSQNVDVIVSDEHMPGMRGGELLAWVANHCPEVMRIVLTGHPTVETAVRAINEGRVYQFFTKPCDPVLLGVTIRKALEHKDLVRETDRLTDLSRRQAEVLGQCGDALDALAAIIAQRVQTPLGQIPRARQSAEGPLDDPSDRTGSDLAERALDGVAEVARLVDALKCRCRGPGPTPRS